MNGKKEMSFMHDRHAGNATGRAGVVVGVWLRRLGPPVVAFVLVRMLLALALARATPFASVWQGSTWARWDSGHYLNIAQHGYDYFPCPHDAARACGNAGWMPGYPYLMAPLVRAIASTAGERGVDARPAAIGAGVSAAFCLLTLVWLWIFFLKCKLDLHSGVALLFFAVAPGAVYQHAVFPVSMFLFLALVQAVCLFRGRWVWAGLCGALAAFTYSTGFLLAPVAAACAAIFQTGTLRVRLRASLLSGGISALGFLAVLVLHQLQLGVWDAFVQVQAKYGHGMHNPMDTWLGATHALPQGGSTSAQIISIQTVFVGATLVLALGALVVFLRRGRRLPAADSSQAAPEIWAIVYALPFWCMPLIMGAGVSMYRAESLLAPLAILLRSTKVAVAVLWLAFAGWLFLRMAELFFNGTLI